MRSWFRRTFMWRAYADGYEQAEQDVARYLTTQACNGGLSEETSAVLLTAARFVKCGRARKD